MSSFRTGMKILCNNFLACTRFTKEEYEPQIRELERRNSVLQERVSELETLIVGEKT